MTHVPITWKDEYEVIKVHCQPYVDRGQESVLVASSDRYEALQEPNGLVWVRYNVPSTRRVVMAERGLRN
jgi:hypothetical protein